ncbi:phosphatidylethanolamine-binding protein [Blastomyces dermatitidis ER-3]|uniref:Phosphatidylethanolamine-binding protein n=3 Tax=Blastomyces TaxID=229219 RepID=A0A179U6P9_BLAGS|nr:uncharacterized protein BDBG_00140 [Blastomyces gilchristii SLH14081]XP_045282598.1 phosphatidylethanolamine-binding protein [Blastomyces dermatitidis ER-3]EGE78336.2 phosphatidylethanolamine-binding protein [Blastomyces dermatitidis ATCC 18188]OAT02871.1 phosphatidylethanolamine-binding protein [Blastomyces dermatitidis ER-3]OAT03413.1 hypothetical protein BDBG_00140 [Blastomyces gilchristii SLH14081]
MPLLRKACEYDIMALLLCYIFATSLVTPATMASHGPPQFIQAEESRIYSPIRDALIGASIIPDVLDDFEPTFSLLISYPSTHTTIALGSYISPSAVRSQPVFEFHPFLIPLSSNTNPNPSPHPTPASKPHRSEKSYSIILTDPDAKSRKHPIWSEMCHWIVSNISIPWPVSLQQQDANNPSVTSPSYNLIPRVLKSYLPPSPPSGTEYHRYVFVLLEGDAATAYNITAPRKRKHWGYGGVRRGVRDWAKEYGLEVVGASFFYAKAAQGDELTID